MSDGAEKLGFREAQTQRKSRQSGEQSETGGGKIGTPNVSVLQFSFHYN